MSTPAEALEYETLARDLAQRLADAFGNQTESCDHNINLAGRGTSNQIDVHWVGQINGRRHRILIECKRHKKPLSQGYVHAFRSVIDDIASDGVPTTGVFMHPVGYQKGAKSLAKTYDVVLTEVREPTDADLANRVLQINIDLAVSQLVVQNVQFDWVETFENEWPKFLAESAVVQRTNGRTAIGVQQLLALQLGATLEEQQAAAEASEVSELQFPEPTPIEIDGRVVGKAIGVRGQPHVSRYRTNVRVGPGREGIAYVVKNVLGAQTAWFTVDGAVRVIDD